MAYVDFLTALTRVSADTRSENNSTWCAELFKRAVDLKPSDANYLPARKNGVSCLSKTDPISALKKFRELTKDNPFDTDEDVRTDSAINVFLAAWNHSRFDALDDVRELAKLNAENGGYPYRAMGGIIRELARVRDEKSVNLATAIFQDALDAYKARALSFDNTNGELLDLFQSAHVIVRGSEYRKGLHTFTESLMSSAANDKTDYAGTIYTSTGQITFRNRDRLILFRLFPLLIASDADDTAKVKTLFPEMASATGDVEFVWQGVIQGGTTPENSDELETRMREGRILERLRTFGQLDARAASDLAEDLHTPANRVLGLSYVISTAAQSDISYARQLYGQQQEDANKVKDPNQKLSTTVALAKSARQVHDDVTFVNLASSAFDDVERTFAGATTHINKRGGYQELADLVEFGLANHATWLLQRIEAVRNPLLKAYLLVSAAEGLSKQTSVHASLN